MVPKSAKKPIARTCPVCEKKLASKEALVNHIEKEHSSQIPDDWDAARYENYLRTKVTHGNCIECGEPTSWNEATWKYNRLCDKPKCREANAKRAKKNMITTYGKVHLLNDPEMQRKMIYSKRNSGTYYWSTDKDKKYKIMYASSQEKNFLEMLDVFLNMDPADVMGPSPHTYAYKYEGKEHFYIPDYYIQSLNLEVEIKEPADNQNMHPKIQAVDKVKEQIKDDMMKTIKQINYIKINGTDYSQFFAFLSYMKEQDEVIPKSTVERGVIEENLLSDIAMENPNYMDLTARFNTLVNNTLELENPNLGYKDVEKRLTRLIQTTKRKDVPYIDAEFDRVEAQLEETSNKDIYDYDSENAYTAGKTLKRIRTRLRPRWETKKRSLMDFAAESFYMEEDEIDYTHTGYIMESFITGVKDGIVMRPIFVTLSYTDTPAGRIIKQVTKQPYTHACISLDSDMNHMASFNFYSNTGKSMGGFSPDESFNFGGYQNKDSYYAIYMYLAPQDEFDAIEEAIERCRKDYKNLNYSFRGVINYAFHRDKAYDGAYFCSEFVADMLKTANPKLLKKHPNQYSPGDLALVRHLRCVDKGLIKDFDYHKLDNKVAKILRERGAQSVTIK